MFSRVEDLPKAIADVEEVACRTYHRGLGFGFKRDVEHLQRFEMEAKTGRLRICILYAGGKPLAFWIGFVYGDTFYSAFTGYQSEMRDHEPGTLVLVFLIDRLCEEGLRVFDFGLGDGFYKQRFADDSWTEACISVYRLGVRGIWLKLCSTLCHYLGSCLEAAIRQLGVLKSLKRNWRGMAAKRSHRKA